MKIKLLLGAVVIAGIIGFYISKKSEAPASQQAEQSAPAQSEQTVKLEKLLADLRAATQTRGAVVLDLIKVKAIAEKDVEAVKSKVSYLESAQLVTQSDFDTFDQFQNDVSQSIANYISAASKKSSSSKEYLKIFKTIESVDRQIDQSRIEYTKLALEINALGTQAQPLPVFKAAEAAIKASAPPTTSL